MNEPGGWRSEGVGGMVFSPKRPKSASVIPFLCVFLLQFFRGGLITSAQRGAAPPKGLGGE